MTKLHGVNLGGWLVLEKWLTPTLFRDTDAVDEFSLMSTPKARARLRRHRQTFITKDDFAWLAAHGINTVRIPVGHWVFGDRSPYIGCIEYLDWAIETAAEFDMQVIIDLHRAPGSQDGHDTGVEPAQPEWFDSPIYAKQTLDVLLRLAERYYSASNVWGISLLNEPKLNLKRFFQLRRFYRTSYCRLIKVMRPGMRVIISDGFLPRLMSGAVWPEPSFPVVLDCHLYNFSEPWDGLRTLGGHLRRARLRAVLIKWLQLRQPMIVGEWSGVISGRKMRRVKQERQRTFERTYIRLQRRAYEHAAGQFYWTYKTENPGIWSFRTQVENGNIEVNAV